MISEIRLLQLFPIGLNSKRTTTFQIFFVFFVKTQPTYYATEAMERPIFPSNFLMFHTNLFFTSRPITQLTNIP